MLARRDCELFLGIVRDCVARTFVNQEHPALIEHSAFLLNLIGPFGRFERAFTLKLQTLPAADMGVLSLAPHGLWAWTRTHRSP